jgi:hypothetical protein
MHLPFGQHRKETIKHGLGASLFLLHTAHVRV